MPKWALLSLGNPLCLRVAEFDDDEEEDAL
jgi:hypothetical protein